MFCSTKKSGSLLHKETCSKRPLMVQRAFWNRPLAETDTLWIWQQRYWWCGKSFLFFKLAAGQSVSQAWRYGDGVVGAECDKMRKALQQGISHQQRETLQLAGGLGSCPSCCEEAATPCKTQRLMRLSESQIFYILCDLNIPFCFLHRPASIKSSSHRATNAKTHLKDSFKCS